MKAAVIVAILLLQAVAPRTASIQGTVKRTDNAPLANARVELFSGPDTPIVARTDGGGRFSFGNLAAGAYRIRVTRDGFLRQEFGARSLDLPGALIAVNAGQRVADINFVMTPASSLAGVVTDDHGEALPDVLIQAMRSGYDPRGNPILRPEFFALTDDLGRYRLFWIDPSDYIISATATPDVLEILGSKSNANRSRAPLGFVPTYHTGVTDPRGIEPLAVATGAELEGMDFHLTRNPFIRIRGNVVAAEGQQAEGATVELAPLIRVAVGPLRRQQAKKEGQFEIQGVTPGKYQLSARSSSGARGVAFLDVTTDSVNEVHIPLLASVTLHGQVYLDSTSTLDFQSMQIALVPLDRDLMPPLIAGIAPGGKFALEHVETGAYLVEVGSLPNNAYMAAARIGSENVLQKEVNISGEPSNPLEILLKVDGGVLSGNVNDAEGKPVADAQIVLVPDASRRRPDQYRTAIADERGNFALRGIPPGEYIAYAWDRIEPNAFLNADFMLRYAESGIPVRIASGSNAPLALRPARR